jgi:NADPH-dependent curcumin reductase CurA
MSIAKQPEALPDNMKQWVLASRPKGLATVENFSLQTTSLPEIKDGELLVQTLYLGVAPVMLRYMLNETSFEKPLEIGDVMHGRGVGRIVESQHSDYKVGDIIQAKLGWREFAVVDGNDPYFMIYKMKNTDLPASHGISSLAMSGFTALIGMKDICKVKAGDQVLISGAAGGVGSQAGFVARALGAGKIVGIAGGDKKCRILTERLGYDATIDYKNDDVAEKLDEQFPNGIDVYFDNVFGEILDEVLLRINRRAKIALCGRISEYLKSPNDYHRFKNLWRLGLQDAKLEAFFVYDYTEHFSEYEEQLATWIREGKLKPLEHILEGLEKMPEGLISLYEGKNTGVLMVKIAG